jgi:hypothetical protein
MRILSLLDAMDKDAPLKTLKRREHTVVLANGLPDLLAHLKDSRFDVVLCQDEYRDPQLAVIDIVEKIRSSEAQYDLPVVCCRLKQEPLPDHQQKQLENCLLKAGAQGMMAYKEVHSRRVDSILKNTMSKAVGTECVVTKMY